MRLLKKIPALVAGVASLAVVASVPVSAQTTHATLKGVGEKEKHAIVALDQSNNAAVDVATEADCTTHTLTARVTNKTDAKITPNVTFNNEEPTLPSTMPIEPGKTGYYFYNFSGNHILVKTQVATDGQAPVVVSPTMHCEEPVSFRVDQTSKSAVTGYLTNNSSMVSQTVLTRVNNGDIHTETVAPGESRLIALPFAAQEGQTNAYVEIGTTAGYEGSYTVDLTRPIIRPLDAQ